jgi:transglutaminase-like putative cysteine protease
VKIAPRLLYFLCFTGLAVVAALALNGAVQPSMATILLRTAIVAALCGAPGLIHRKLWPLSLALLPVGAYLLLRTIMPIPALVEGVGGQYSFYVEQLRLGADAYVSQVFPLSSTDVPELALMLAFSVYWLAGAAAFVSLSLRRPVPGIVLLLVLLGFGLTIDDATRVLWSALLFLVLAACLLVLARGVKRAEWTFRDTLAGGAVGVAASLLALLVLTAAPSVVATPWGDWRAWDPFRQGPSTYTFNWLQNYPVLLDPDNDMVIMRVESSSPSYWRANALETFTGRAWTTAQGFLASLEKTRSGEAFVYVVPKVSPIPPGPTATQTFRVESVYTNYLFVGGDPISFTVGQDLVLRTNPLRAIHSNRALGPSLVYTVDAVVPDLEPADVMDRGSVYPETVRDYLALPFPHAAEIAGPDREAAWQAALSERLPAWEEWIGLYALNQQIVGDASDPYEVTVRIERYLRRFFQYSLDESRSDYSSPYAAFLFDTRSGYCQHFAGAMALLLRYNDIPARVAVGFATGEEEEPGIYTVSTNNAHAWVEVYFPDVGWVAFDPTPTDNIPPIGTDPFSPGFVNPFVETDLNGSGAMPPMPAPDNIPADQPSGDGAIGAEGDSWFARATWLPWVLGVAVLLTAWPLGRSLWRRRGLHRGSPEEQLQTSLRLLRRDMSDHGLVAKPSHTLEDTFSVLETQLGIDPDPLLIARAEAIFFGGYGASEMDLDQAEALRRVATVRLRRRHGWLRRGLTWYGVPRIDSLRRREA